MMLMMMMMMMMVTVMVILQVSDVRYYQSISITTALPLHHLDTKPYFLKSFRRRLRQRVTWPPVLATATSDRPSAPAARRASTNSVARAAPSQLLSRPRAVLACGRNSRRLRRWTPGRVGRWAQP